MRKNKKLALVVASLVLATLWGCGSNMDSGGDQTQGAAGSFGTDGAGIKYVGASTCISCHEGFSWSEEAVAAYLEGKHVIHSDHITAASGTCLECHDPIGDGRTLEGLIDADDVPAEGLAAVTCETCHGAGGEHYGAGPIPNASPDFNACGQCHNSDMDHNAYHPEADNIVEDYTASAHRGGNGERNTTKCTKCHTDEGARAYKNVMTSVGLDSAVPVVDVASPIQCRTCHDPHNPGELLKPATVSRTGAVTGSAEYNTCTNCHQKHNAAVGTTVVSSGVDVTAGTTDGSSGDVLYHTKRLERMISDTHNDDPATGYGKETNLIEGYAMKASSERVCRDCHNVHSGDLTINREWAASAHGGHILHAKEEAIESTDEETLEQTKAVIAAGSDSEAWAHYDWDKTFKADGTDAGTLPDKDRADCQRCHTSTGAMNFMKNPAAYNPANNDFSHLVGWKVNADGTTTSSGQNEMLYCWACHANNSGALRNPGAISEVYEGTVAAPLVKVDYPNVNGSNVCMTCHLGRETGAVVKTKTGFDNLSFVNSHYLAAGGSVFGQTGYTFGSRDYSIPAGDTHVKIGTGTTGNAAVDANYTNGPCVSCHFDSNDGSHTLSPLTEYAVGDVALNPVCVNCHATRGAGTNAETTWLGTDAIAATLQGSTHKARYQAALEALKVQLDAKGIFFSNDNPYFFTAPYNDEYTEEGACTDNLPVKNWQTGGTSTFTWSAADNRCNSTVNVAGTTGTGMNNMGAAFNYNLLEHEPGGVAHNRRYTRRLIYDSIDWLDDANLNYSVSATLAALDSNVAVYKDSATSYLINAGTGNVNLGTAAERY